MSEGRAGTTLDRLLDGKVILNQPGRGHRAGTDAVLLAAAAPAGAAHIVDLGAGVGAVGIAAAFANPAARLTLIEIDPATARLAGENIELNGLSERGRVLLCDVFGSAQAREAAGLTARSADLVLTNPPFDTAGKGRVSPHPARRLAHVMPYGGLEQWVGSAAHLLEPKGQLVMIHRADSILLVLRAMEGRFGALRLIFIHPDADRPATRVLVRGVIGSRSPLTVLSPLVLHAGPSCFTAEAEALHRGAAHINWEKGGVTPW